MEHKWKRLAGYYRPYRVLFFADLLFAILGAGVSLGIPLIVRYITTNVIILPGNEALQIIAKLGAVMLAMVALECYCNFFIAYYGHIMGAKIEHDMRNEIFEHYQKLSFTFFDNQKVGQLLSRVTTD
ncbi:MAG: ABC transporter transmembrane domain-containing protein, partial [Lachnospiraceae bacterium]